MASEPFCLRIFWNKRENVYWFRCVHQKNLLRLFIKHFSVKLKKGSTFMLVRRFAKLIFMRCCFFCPPLRDDSIFGWENLFIFKCLCHSEIYSRLSTIIHALWATVNVELPVVLITRSRHLHKRQMCVWLISHAKTYQQIPSCCSNPQINKRENRSGGGEEFVYEKSTAKGIYV